MSSHVSAASNVSCITPGPQPGFVRDKTQGHDICGSKIDTSLGVTQYSNVIINPVLTKVRN